MSVTSVLSASRAAYEPLRSIGFGAIGNIYAPIGTPLLNPMRIIAIKNNTDSNLIFSIDGITDHESVSANSGTVIDYSTNRADKGGVMELPAGTLWYVRLEAGGAATLGTVYITAIFASQK